MGVGLANQLMAPAGQATSGVDWSQAISVFSALFWSPLIGFVASAGAAAGHEAPGPQAGRSTKRPRASSRRRWWIRGLLILTCTGVSFAPWRQ